VNQKSFHLERSSAQPENLPLIERANDGREGDILAVVNRETMEALVHKAKALRADWLLAREEHLAEQLAANVEIRRVWIEADPIWDWRDQSGGFANAAV
jgi:hypothetical protein